MSRKNQILILLGVVLAVALIVYGRTQGWLPLNLEGKKAAPAREALVAADLNVKLEVGGKTYQATIKEGGTAFDLMKNLEAGQGLKFSAKEYSGLGALVEEINGVKNDVKANKFWIFYVNGKASTVGLSGYVLKNNDVIKWNYESYKF